jgi:hypothetical protein
MENNMYIEPELVFMSIMFGIVGFIILIANPFWAICLVVILQVVVFLHFVPTFVSKWMFGAIYVLWLITWGSSYLGRKGGGLQWHPVAKPAMFLAIVMGVEIIIGLCYGATLLNMIRDISPYLGYLAIFPVMDIVRSRRQAKRIIKIFAILGLPGFVLDSYSGYLAKQQIGGGFSFAPNAAPYWEPIQGALWAVALGYNRLSTRLAAWGWLGLSSLIPIFGGARGLFLAYLVGAATAFKAASRLGSKSLGKYLVPLGIGLVLVALAGFIKLPFSKVTTTQYRTLTNLHAFENDPSVEGRVVEIKALLAAFMRNPITGVGFGYPLKYAWGDRGERKIEGLWFTYHNGYGETLMKFGLIGSLIFAWFYWSALRMSYRIISSGDTFFSKAIALGTVVWLVSSLVKSVGNSAFSNRGFALALGVIVGLLPTLAGQNPYKKETLGKPSSSPVCKAGHSNVNQP